MFFFKLLLCTALQSNYPWREGLQKETYRLRQQNAVVCLISVFEVAEQLSDCARLLPVFVAVLTSATQTCVNVHQIVTTGTLTSNTAKTTSIQIVTIGEYNSVLFV